MIILSTKLRNAVKRFNPKGNYEFYLKNVNINGIKKGCTGFIVNKDNGLILYVDTEPCLILEKPLMYRYAKSTRDYRGSVNRWALDLDDLVGAIYWHLKEDRERRA